MRVCGQRHAPAAFPPGRRSGTCCIGDWVDPECRSGLVRKISPHQTSNPRLIFATRIFIVVRVTCVLVIAEASLNL